MTVLLRGASTDRHRIIADGMLCALRAHSGPFACTLKTLTTDNFMQLLDLNAELVLQQHTWACT